MTTIYNSRYDIDGEDAGSTGGYSVSMNSAGDIVAIGAKYNDGENGDISGHVRVYKNSNGSWEQLGIDIDGESSDDRSGQSVSINSAGNIVAIGAINNDGENGGNSGHTRVWKYKDGTWQKLGQDIDGETAGDYSGYSVSINSAGTIVAIGSKHNDVATGHVRVYQYKDDPGNPGTKKWDQLGIDIDGESEDDQSGFSVSMNSAGDIVAIGAKFNTSDDGKNNSGHVRVHQYINGAWIQVGDDIDGESASDSSGKVSMNSTGDIIAIGAKNNDIGDNSGHVRVWKSIIDPVDSDKKKWIQVGDDIDGEFAGDNSGVVSMNSTGDIVAIGAGNNSDNGDKSGHVRIWKLIGSTWQRLGQDIDGETEGDRSGYSVSMNNEATVVAIGSVKNDDNGENSGHVRVFYYRNGIWNQATPGFFKVSNGFFKLSGTSFFKV